MGITQLALLVIVTDVSGCCSVTSESLAMTQRFSGASPICVRTPPL